MMAIAFMPFTAVAPDSSVVATTSSSAVDFLQLVLPGDGWLVGLAHKGDKRRQQAFSTIDELLTWLARYDVAGWDTYHACASFAQPRVWNPNKINPKTKQLGAWEIRTHANVDLVASLWIDVDTRESKDNAAYADREEAYQAVVAFCQSVGIPLPLFVSSGGGLHCYWPLDVELDLKAWEVWAYALKAALQHHGVDADPSRTADASSVLRTPLTHHHKSGRIVAAGELVGPYPLKMFDPLKAFAPKAPRRRKAGQAVSTDSILGQLWADEPTDPEKIVAKCQQLAALAANINGPPEPIHYAAAGVFARCKPNGREYFKQISRGYRGLPAVDTDAWCDTKMDQNLAATTGPTTCKRFKALKPAGCDGCPYWGEITSPIILGRRIVPLVLPHKPSVVLP
jgi:hypothetical protein